MKIFSAYCDYNEDNDPQGCGFYRIVQPMESLKRKGYEVEVNGKFIKRKLTIRGWKDESAESLWSRVFENNDIVFVQNVSNKDGIVQLLAARDYFKKPVVIDIDDDITCVSQNNPCSTEWKKGGEKRFYSEFGLHNADAITVSTERLKEVYKNLNPNVYVLENRIHPDDWYYEPTKSDDGKVRIGYAGSISHVDDYAMVHPYIVKILKKYKHVEFSAIGFWHPLMSQLPHDRRHFTPGTAKYAFRDWPKLLSKSKIDIGICPLVLDEFNKGKSPIKYMEYSVYGIPTIATRDTSLPYYKVIRDKETGLLASYEGEWIKNLEMLIEEPVIRQKLGENAKRYVCEHYNIDDYSEKYLKVFDEVLCNFKKSNLKCAV